MILLHESLIAMSLDLQAFFPAKAPAKVGSIDGRAMRTSCCIAMVMKWQAKKGHELGFSDDKDLGILCCPTLRERWMDGWLSDSQL